MEKCLKKPDCDEMRRFAVSGRTSIWGEQMSLEKRLDLRCRSQGAMAMLFSGLPCGRASWHHVARRRRRDPSRCSARPGHAVRAHGGCPARHYHGSGRNRARRTRSGLPPPSLTAPRNADCRGRQRCPSFLALSNAAVALPLPASAPSFVVQRRSSVRPAY